MLYGKKLFLPLTAFVVGASVMAVEMTASRVLAPHFGASFFVWTALIVTVLLSMSLGYWVGGKYATRTPDNTQPLGLLLSSASALLLVGIWGSANLSNSAPVLFELLGGASSALFIGALLVSFLLFSFPVFVLAMSSPVILKLWTADSGDVGSVAGKYFAISTAGSVIGTVLPSLLLVPNIGVRMTFILVACILAMLGLPALKGKFRLAAVTVVALAFLVAISQTTDNRPSDVYAKETPYQLIRVREHEDGKRFLIFNEGSGTQSVYFPGSERTDMYFDHMTGIVPLAGEGSRLRTAILGLAGGSLIRQYLTVFPPDVEPDIIGVEVDPEVIEVGREFFAVGEMPIDIVNEDGRIFLANSEREFDVIFTDAYSTQMYIPSHMVSIEFFELTKQRLAPGGLVSMNVNAPARDSELLLAISNTVAAVYPHVYIHKAGRTWNWLVTASEHELDYVDAAEKLPELYGDVAEGLLTFEKVKFNPDIPILTDDWAPVEFMTDKMVISDALRRALEH